MDRFLIAPYDKESGLQKNLNTYLSNACSGRIKELTRKGIMGLKYRKRRDVIDMVGRRSGKLVVLSFCNKPGQRGAFWLCKCDCGNETIADGNHLRMTGSKARKSCGCNLTENIEKTGINRIFSTYKTKAKKRGIDFELSREEFLILIKGNCSYCGSEPNQLLKRQKTRKIQIIYNGIDRIDSEKGYTKNNCVSCCMYCNRSKSNLSLEAWKNHIKRIYQWLWIDS